MATKPLIFRIQASKDSSVDAALNSTAKSIDAAADAAQTVGTETTKAGRAAAASAKAMETAFDKAEDAAKPLGKTMSELVERIKKLGTDGAAATAKLNSYFETLAGSAKELSGSLAAENLGRGADFLRDLSGAAGNVYDSFDRAGQGVRELERSMQRVFSDPAKAKEFSKIAKDIKAQYEGLFSNNQITESIGALNRFGVASEATAKRVAAIAASDPNLSPSQVAETYGEFRKSALGGKHDFGSTEQLRSQLGIDPKELVPFGAELDSNNKLLGDTAEQATKAQTALDRFLDSQDKYKGVADRASDAQSKLSTEMDKFRDTSGSAVNEFKEFIAKGLLPGAKYLNSFGDSTKAAVAGTAGAVKGAASLGASVAQTGAFALLAANQFKTFTAGATGVVTAAQLAAAGTIAMGAGMVTAAAGVAVIVYQFYEMVKAANQAEAAEKSLRETQAKALEGRRGGLVDQDVEALQSAADAYEDYGKRRAFVTDAILAKDAAADKAKDDGDKAAEERYRADLNRLKIYREQLDETVAIEVEGNERIAKSHEEAYARALEAYKAFKKEQGRGKFETANEAATALAATIPGLQGDARDEAESDLRKLRKAGLKEDLQDLKTALELRRATEKLSLADELADLKKQSALVSQLGRDGAEEEVRIAKEVAAAKAAAKKVVDAATKESAKKTKAEAINELKDATKLDTATTTYDRGTGRALDAYEQAIQKVKAWKDENAKLIKQFPELGKKGEEAIDKLRLGQAQANVARMAKNFGDLKRELKLLEDEAVTTKDKLAAVAEEREKIDAAVASKDISKEQGDELRGPLGDKKADLDRKDAQEQVQQRQALLALNQTAAQQELALAETLADGTQRNADKIFLAKAKLHEFAIAQIKAEQAAAEAAGEDKVAVAERTNLQLANLDRERTLDILRGKKAEIDAERDKIQQILDLNKPAQAKKTQLDFSGVPTDQASFFSVGLSGEEYQKRRETRRAERELKKLDAAAAFQQANPELVAKIAKEDYERRLRAADPRGVIKNVDAKMQKSLQQATGGNTTVNNSNTAHFHFNGRSGRTENIRDNDDAVRKVKKALDDQAFFNGGPGSGLGFA